MSKFLDVTLTNYGSFNGKHAFRLLDRGLCLILGDNRDEPRMNSNGAGKSMIPDALDWCLFGQVPRGDVAASVVNEKAGKGTEVITRVQLDDGSILTAARRRKVKGEKDGLRFWVGEEELTTLDTNESQTRLEKVLGMDRDVFHAAVLFAQFDDWKFADATDAQRKELLTKIIPELSIIDTWLTNAKLRMKEVQEELTAAVATEAQKQQALQNLSGNDPRPLFDQWEGQRAQRVAEIQTKVTEYQNGLAALAAEMQANPFQTPPPPPPEPPELTALRPQVEQAGQALNSWVQAQAAAQGKRAALLEAAEQVAAGKNCPTCGQPVDPGQPPPDHLHAQAQLDLQEADRELAAAQAHHQQLSQRAGEIHQSWFVQTQQHAQEVQTITVLNDRYTRLHKRHEEVSNELADFVLELQKAQQEQANPYAQQVENWLQTHAKLTAELDAARHDVVHLESRLPYYKFWVDAFGPRGIKSHILDSRLQEMTDEANRWVHMLTGGTIWVRFETQTKTGKGKSEKLVDKFSVRVFRHNPDGTQSGRNYRSWCGGEKHRIGTGIDFGLARLVANRSASSYDILFLDEIFGKHLDQAGKEAVAEMLQHLAHEKSSIFVIDHDPRFQGTFAETVVVQKVNGDSTILEASHG